MMSSLPRLLFLFIAVCGLSGASAAFELMGLKWPAGSMELDYDFELEGKSKSPSGYNWNQAFEDAAGDWNEKANFTINTDDSNPSHPCALTWTAGASAAGIGAAFGTAYVDDKCNAREWSRLMFQRPAT